MQHYENMQTTTEQTEQIDTEPPISVSKFMEQSGLSAATVWRYRQKGWLTTHNISGRQYISRADLGEFNRRMKAGEFAQQVEIKRKGA